MHLVTILSLITITCNKSVFSSCDSQWAEEMAKNESYPIDSFQYKSSFSDGCNCLRKDFRDGNLCFRKCCQRNYILNGGECVFDKNNTFEDYPIFVYKNDDDIDVVGFTDLKFLPGEVICDPNVKVKFSDELGEPFTFMDGVINEEDGKFWMIEENIRYDYNQYCVEYSEGQNEILAFICRRVYVEDLNFGDRLSFIGAIISLPFLLATFIVYALLPQRTLHGSALMCYVMVLFIAFFMYVFSYLYKGNVTPAGCKSMGMLSFFCFMSSMLWMNVMSYDIYTTFKGTRGFEVNKRSKQRRKFFIYSAYAWSIPLLFIGLIMTLSHTVKPNKWYDPGVRGEECFLRDGYPELLYFYGPIAILITANIVMFVMTAIRIRRIQKDTEMLTGRGSQKHSDNDDQHRFSLYIKLLFAMGINWTVEIISWALNWLVGNIPPAVWYLTDFCNAAYGVVIFFVFVFKKSVWNQLKKRYNMITGNSEATQSSSL